MVTMFDYNNSNYVKCVFYHYNLSELLGCRFFNNSIFQIDKSTLIYLIYIYFRLFIPRY